MDVQANLIPMDSEMIKVLSLECIKQPNIRLFYEIVSKIKPQA